MKHAFPIAVLAGALVAPSLASARQVSFETQLSNYGGDGAYVAMYVTDRVGRYQGTLWWQGEKPSTTGTCATGIAPRAAPQRWTASRASVGAGKTLRATLDLSDALIDAGYEVHIDTAVEDMKEYPSEVVVPLTTSGANKMVKGSGYVKSFRYSL